jgi:PTS system galactitol-specific IIA component
MVAAEMPVVAAIGLRAACTGDALRLLAARLVDAGCVDARYADAVIDREGAFPTGLPTDPPVALPHADPNYVLRNAVAVGVFAEPIAFREMGTPGHELRVRLVFLLALRAKEDAASLLRQLILNFREGNRLARLQDASTDDDARRLAHDLLTSAPQNEAG